MNTIRMMMSVVGLPCAQDRPVIYKLQELAALCRSVNDAGDCTPDVSLHMPRVEATSDRRWRPEKPDTSAQSDVDKNSYMHSSSVASVSLHTI